MGPIDRAEWQPVASWKVDAFLLILAALDVSLIAWAVWFFHVKGWL